MLESFSVFVGRSRSRVWKRLLDVKVEISGVVVAETVVEAAAVVGGPTVAGGGINLSRRS